MKLKKSTKRFLGLLLAAALIFGSLDMNSFVTLADENQDVAVEEVAEIEEINPIQEVIDEVVATPVEETEEVKEETPAEETLGENSSEVVEEKADEPKAEATELKWYECDEVYSYEELAAMAEEAGLNLDDYESFEDFQEAYLLASQPMMVAAPMASRYYDYDLQNTRTVTVKPGDEIIFHGSGDARDYHGWSINQRSGSEDENRYATGDWAYGRSYPNYYKVTIKNNIDFGNDASKSFNVVHGYGWYGSESCTITVARPEATVYVYIAAKDTAKLSDSLKNELGITTVNHDNYASVGKFTMSASQASAAVSNPAAQWSNIVAALNSSFVAGTNTGLNSGFSITRVMSAINTESFGSYSSQQTAFLGWTDETSVGWDGSYGCQYHLDILLDSYNVTYVDENGQEIGKVSYLKGSDLEQPTATNKQLGEGFDYEHTTYYSDSACTKAVDFATAKVNSDVTVYAKTAKEFTVTYKLEGKVLETVKVRENDTLANPAEDNLFGKDFPYNAYIYKVGQTTVAFGVYTVTKDITVDLDEVEGTVVYVYLSSHNVTTDAAKAYYGVTTMDDNKYYPIGTVVLPVEKLQFQKHEGNNLLSARKWRQVKDTLPTAFVNQVEDAKFSENKADINKILEKITNKNFGQDSFTNTSVVYYKEGPTQGFPSATKDVYHLNLVVDYDENNFTEEYTVHHYFDGTEIEIAQDTTVEVATGETPSPETVEVVGFTPVTGNPVVDEENKTVTIKYVYSGEINVPVTAETKTEAYDGTEKTAGFSVGEITGLPTVETIADLFDFQLNEDLDITETEVKRDDAGQVIAYTKELSADDYSYDERFTNVTVAQPTASLTITPSLNKITVYVEVQAGVDAKAIGLNKANGATGNISKDAVAAWYTLGTVNYDIPEELAGGVYQELTGRFTADKLAGAIKSSEFVANANNGGFVSGCSAADIENLINNRLASKGAKLTLHTEKNEGWHLDLYVTGATNVANITGLTTEYDGLTHGPQVVEEEGVTYTYTYNGETVDKDSFADAGTYEVTVTATKNGLQPVSKTVTVKITKAPLTVTTLSQSWTYDGESHSYNDGANVTGLKNNETATVKTTASVKEVSDGEKDNGYEIEWGTAKAANYDIVEENLGTIQITPVVEDISVDSLKNVSYNGKEQKLAPVVKDTKNNKTLVAGRDYEVAYSDDCTNVGTVTVTITGKGNYKFETSVVYNITKVAITITVANKTKVYKEADPELTAEVSDGEIAGEKIEYTLSRAAGENVGEYKITATKAENAVNSNYEITVVDGKFEITPLSIEGIAFTVNPIDDVVYNGVDQKLPPVVLENGQTLEDTSYNVTYSADTKNFGEVTVTITGKGNYSGSKEVSYKITKAPLKITTFSKTVNYGIIAKADGEVTGLVNGETVGFKTVGQQQYEGKSKNKYEITFAEDDATYTARKSNYNITDEIGVLTVVYNPSTGDEDGQTPTPAPALVNTPAVIAPTPVPAAGPAAGQPAAQVAEADNDNANEDVAEIADEATPLAGDGDQDTEEIADEETPLAIEKSWAVVNLIMAILTVLLGVFYFIRKRRDDEDEEEQQDDNYGKTPAWSKVVGVVAGLGSVIAFILTEDMTQPMRFADKWTFLMIVIALIQAVVLYFAKKEAAEEDEKVKERA